MAAIAGRLCADTHVGHDLEGHPLADEVAEALCAYLPYVFAHKYRRWALESLDHVSLTLLRSLDEYILEAAGLCVLISDPTTMPFHVRLHLSSNSTGIPKVLCRAGEMHPSSGDTLRLAWNSDFAKKYAKQLNQRLDAIVWKYEVELVDAPES